MDACPALFKRGGYNFRLPPLKVRDLRLDLGKKFLVFVQTLIVFENLSSGIFGRRPNAIRELLKDERRTSNIERPTSNKKTNIQYWKLNDYFCFFSAVLILVTKILINSSVSFKISFSSSGFLISGTF